MEDTALPTQMRSASVAPQPQSKPSQKQRQNGLFGFMRIVFSSGDMLSEEATEQTAQEVTDFFMTPFHLEKLLYFGFFLCLDSFLFLFTILPLRIVIAVGKLVIAKVLRTGSKLSINQQCDIMRGAIVVIVCFCLQQVDASKLYHIIRAQETIKLYVIFNVLEIFDKYCAWLGQDILDALFVRRRQRRIFVLAVAYTLVHSLVNFGQVMCLNVAINSYDSALLSMLVSNQFVELKGNVFKKFGRDQINKIACYDMVERFYQLVFLFIIGLRNLQQVDFDFYYLEREFFLFVVVFGSEIFVDWIKHAFLSKFNGFNWSVYNDISLDLSRDVMYGHGSDALLTAEPRKRKFLDQSHLVTRRLGFVNLPLACLLVRILMQSMPRPHGLNGLAVLVLTWLCLTALKVLVNVMIVGRAAKELQAYERRELFEQLLRAQQELDHVQANFAGDTMDETWSLPRSYAPSEASLTSLLRRPQYESGKQRGSELWGVQEVPDTFPGTSSSLSETHSLASTAPTSPGLTPISSAPATLFASSSSHIPRSQASSNEMHVSTSTPYAHAQQLASELSHSNLRRLMMQRTVAGAGSAPISQFNSPRQRGTENPLREMSSDTMYTANEETEFDPLYQSAKDFSSRSNRKSSFVDSRGMPSQLTPRSADSFLSIRRSISTPVCPDDETALKGKLPEKPHDLLVDDRMVPPPVLLHPVQATPIRSGSGSQPPSPRRQPSGRALQAMDFS